MSDPLSDALRELIRAGVDPGLYQRVVGQVRARWVGQCYIGAVDRELRNAEIQAALDAGEPLATVAKRVQASVHTVRRVRREWLCGLAGFRGGVSKRPIPGNSPYTTKTFTMSQRRPSRRYLPSMEHKGTRRPRAPWDLMAITGYSRASTPQVSPAWGPPVSDKSSQRGSSTRS